MGIRNAGMGIMISAISSFVVVIFLILLWPQLSTMVEGMNVGILMFFNINFYQFFVFFCGLIFAVTLIIRFAIKARFGGKA